MKLKKLEMMFMVIAVVAVVVLNVSSSINASALNYLRSNGQPTHYPNPHPIHPPHPVHYPKPHPTHP